MKLVKRPQAQAQITSSCSIAEQRSLDRWRSAWSGSRRQSAASEQTGTDLIESISELEPERLLEDVVADLPAPRPAGSGVGL